MKGVAADRDEYLRGYLASVHASRDELASYVPLWRYMAVTTIWPLATRYLDPQQYDARWDSWCWDAFLTGELGAADARAL